MTSQPGPDLTSPVAKAETLAAAAKLLQAAGITRLPTPVEDLLAHCGLAAERFLFSDPFTERGLPVPLAHARADLRPMVRGMVDVDAHVVYTHRNLGREQQRFVTFHELGHFHLEWHNALLQTCSESDLSPNVRRVWEREANLFARALLFQGSRFANEAGRAFFGWQSLRAMARNYASSLEAAGWEFVQARRHSCVLVVATLGEEAQKTAQAVTGEPLLAVRYAVASPAWWERFGKRGVPESGALIAWDHPATRLLLTRSRAALPAATTIPTPLGDLAVKAELLHNGHDVLILAQPA